MSISAGWGAGMSGLDARLQRAARIAEQAGDVALRYFRARGQLATQCKGPMDFASEADTSVERMLRDELAVHFAGEPIVGEELGGELDARAWVLDPIDGTGNFLRGSPLWGVAVAYVAAGEPVVGAIRYPALGMTLAGATGLGLFVDGQPAMRTVPFADVRIAAIGGNARWEVTHTSALETHLRQHQWFATAYRCASVGLGFAALGYVDGYFEDHTHVWDIAAGMVLCREAGLIVESADAESAGALRVAAGTPALMQVAMPCWSTLRTAVPGQRKDDDEGAISS